MDCNVVMTGDGDLVEVQGTAEGDPFSRAQMDALLDLATAGIADLTQIQRAALGGLMAFPRGSRSRPATTTRSASSARICADWPVRGSPSATTSRGLRPRWRRPARRTWRTPCSRRGRSPARSGCPAMADDSGIEVDALGGRPGLRSARFAGEDATDEENLARCSARSRGSPAGGRTARYRCVAVLASPDGAERARRGTCEGTLSGASGGAAGSATTRSSCRRGGTDTMAELTDEEKDRISHRGRAFRALRDVLEAPEAP